MQVTPWAGAQVISYGRRSGARLKPPGGTHRRCPALAPGVASGVRTDGSATSRRPRSFEAIVVPRCVHAKALATLELRDLPRAARWLETERMYHRETVINECHSRRVYPSD